MNTVFLLMAQFQQAHIPLDQVCDKYFGLDRKQAFAKAKLQQLPVPAFRAGSQQSGWLIDVNDFAKFLDEKAAKARDDHRKMHSAA